MTSRALIRIPLVLGLCVAAIQSQTTPARPVSAAAVFESLKGLVGEWSGQTASGRTLKVSYRLVAAGTVLVEHWTLSAQRDSMTVYHLDGANLLATHYCPIGNQPRLKYVGGSSPMRFEFAFQDSTNLSDPAAAHQHAFTLQLKDASTLIRSETYMEKGQPDTEMVTYTRIK